MNISISILRKRGGRSGHSSFHIRLIYITLRSTWQTATLKKTKMLCPRGKMVFFYLIIILCYFCHWLGFSHATELEQLPKSYNILRWPLPLLPLKFCSHYMSLAVWDVASQSSPNWGDQLIPLVTLSTWKTQVATLPWTELQAQSWISSQRVA